MKAADIGGARPGFLVERKTVADLVQSLREGRLASQLARLPDGDHVAPRGASEAGAFAQVSVASRGASFAMQGAGAPRVVLLIEGSLASSAALGVSPLEIRREILKVLASRDIIALWSADAAESAAWLAALAELAGGGGAFSGAKDVKDAKDKDAKDKGFSNSAIAGRETTLSTSSILSTYSILSTSSTQSSAHRRNPLANFDLTGRSFAASGGAQSGARASGAVGGKAPGAGGGKRPLHGRAAKTPGAPRDAALASLQSIPGLGRARADTLLARFGTLAAIRDCPPADLAQSPGIGPELARRIRRKLNGA